MKNLLKKLVILFASTLSIALPACGGNTPVTGISLNEHEVSVEEGSFVELTATITPNNATNKEITWSSSDEDVAICEGNIIMGIASGEAVITATSKDGNFSDSCKVSVIGEEKELIALSMDSAILSLGIGEEKTIAVTYIPSNATNKHLTWTSTNENIATVDQTGKVKGIVSGSTIITATSDNGKYATRTVNVLAEWVDYAQTDSTAKLNLDYKGKEFFKDGIEKVTLLTPIDGDTAHFNGASGTTIKSRFFGIDTPESTGKVQPWGKKASTFTKNILKEAKTIVVSSPSETYKSPTPDSTGSRYVSLIWVSNEENASFDSLKLVNLMVCQEGLCLYKVDDEFTRYNNVFSKAYQQAKLYQKYLHGTDPDPDFNYSGDYQDVSLLDLKQEVVQYLADPTHKNAYDNVKVRIQGTVVSYANNTMYIQDYFPNNPDNPSLGGEYAGINIFCGMTPIPDKFQVRNTYIEVCGLALDSENFGFQISDTQGRWSMSSSPVATDCKIIYTAEENTEEHSLDNQVFVTTASNLTSMAKNKDTSRLFCYTEVTDPLVCDYFYINDSKEITLGFSNCDVDVFIPFIYYGDPSDDVYRWDESSKFIGKSFIVKGAYCYHKKTSGKISWQICPSKGEDILCTDYIN